MRGGRRFSPSRLRDVAAAAYVAVILDYQAGRVQSPRAEALLSVISLLYSVLYAGRGRLEDGVELLREQSGWVVDGARVSRALLRGLLGLDAATAWEAARMLLEGRLVRKWPLSALLEQLEALRVKPGPVIAWASDPVGLGIRFYNREVDEPLDKLAEYMGDIAEVLGERRVTPAGRMLARLAAKLLDHSPRYSQEVQGEVRKLIRLGF